jgi:hypothetical protein
VWPFDRLPRAEPAGYNMTPKPHDPDGATRSDAAAPQRFARARAIFEAALERRPFERRAFVDGACVGDEALRREVLGMLSAIRRGVVRGAARPHSSHCHLDGTGQAARTGAIP